MRKRKGSMLIGLMVIFVTAPFLITAGVHMLKIETEISDNTYNTIDEYNIESYSDLALMELINDIEKSITSPKTLIDNTIFSYEKALEHIPSFAYDDKLLKLLDTLPNDRIKQLVDTSLEVVISEINLYPDYKNKENILNFITGDILFLAPFEVYIDVTKHNKLYQFSYLISDIYLEIEHTSTDFTMDLRTNKALIERTKWW